MIPESWGDPEYTLGPLKSWPPPNLHAWCLFGPPGSKPAVGNDHRPQGRRWGNGVLGTQMSSSLQLGVAWDRYPPAPAHSHH